MSALAISLLALTTSTASLTSTVKICFKATVQYADSARRTLTDGTLEDYWATQSQSNQVLIGTRVIVTSGGATTFDGYLGDGLGTGDPGAGCTLTMTVNHPTQFFTVAYTLYSRGSVQGNLLYVQNADAGNSYASFSGNVYLSCAGGGCAFSQTVTISPAGDMPVAQWHAYAAAALSLYRHAGGLSGSALTIRVSDIANDTLYEPGTGIVKVRQEDSVEKFTVSHEVGHRLGHLAIGGAAVNTNCGYVDPTCPASNGQHSMGSEEIQSCAFGEGFAHFYAADVWNSHGQSDCVFQYYKATDPAVDCEASGGDHSSPESFPLAMLETCGGDINDHGVEVDWLRTFWDVHTNGTSPPTFTQMIDWMNDAFAVYLTPPYDELDGQANVVGGTLNTNWDGAKVLNGIDH